MAPPHAAEGEHSLRLLETIWQQRLHNGLRHNDYERYRRYCTLRLRRLRSQRSTSKHPGSTDEPEATTTEESNERSIMADAVAAERAWATGMMLKARNASAAQFCARTRKHSQARFIKASRLATRVLHLAAAQASLTDSCEGEAYAALMEGDAAAEKGNRGFAVKAFRRGIDLLCQLLSIADDSQAVALRGFLEESMQRLRQSGEAYEPDPLASRSDDRVEEDASPAKTLRENIRAALRPKLQKMSDLASAALEQPRMPKTDTGALPELKIHSGEIEKVLQGARQRCRHEHLSEVSGKMEVLQGIRGRWGELGASIKHMESQLRIHDVLLQLAQRLSAIFERVARKQQEGLSMARGWLPTSRHPCVLGGPSNQMPDLPSLGAQLGELESSLVSSQPARLMAQARVHSEPPVARKDAFVEQECRQHLHAVILMISFAMLAQWDKVFVLSKLLGQERSHKDETAKKLLNARSDDIVTSFDSLNTTVTAVLRSSEERWRGMAAAKLLSSSRGYCTSDVTIGSSPIQAEDMEKTRRGIPLALATHLPPLVLDHALLHMPSPDAGVQDSTVDESLMTKLSSWFRRR